MTEDIDVNDKKITDIIPAEGDPLRLREVCLNNDFYTLCWSSLRKDIWEDKENIYMDDNIEDPTDEDKYVWRKKTLGGVKLSLTDGNLRLIYIYMFFFIVVVLFVLFGIIHQVFTNEIQASCKWDIRLLRMLLVSLVQMKLQNEFREGLVKLKYSVNNPNKFISVGLAKSIAIFQMVCTMLSWLTLILFICSEVEPLDMIQDFTGICVFTELDDWIGGHICSTTPEINEGEEDNYDLSNLNDRLSLSMKMSLLQMDTNIIEDLNDNGQFLRKFANFFYTHKAGIYFLPLLCIPIEWGYLKFHPYAK